MIRNSMRALPGFMQPFLSWLTAKPLPEDLDKVRPLKPFHHIVVSAGLIAGGALLAGIGYSQASIALWLLGFVLATGGIKQMQVMICHNCAHDMVFESRETNITVGRIISGVLMLKPFDTYKSEHALHHSSKTLLTDDDDTLSYLQSVVGLKPSDSIATMWTKLVSTALSPLAVLRSLWGRLKGTATAANRRVAVLTLVFWAGLALLSAALGHFDLFIVAWVIPIFAGYHISTTFRLAAEHTWPSVDVLERRGIDFICESTTGVFIGEELRIPEDAGTVRRFAHISVWLIKMLAFHLFVRVFVMVGDTPCHDFHHRRPRSKDWPNYITARERDRIEGSKPFPTNYADNWGYINSVTTNFRNFQRALPYYTTRTAT
ncbi:fatty acid desaturase [Pseudomonas fluorescens]|uniref:fatty acid desaturase n=1 Tax=Pseudomonas fluorescens TaxID=294 RepID=UPI002785B92C|nr:fatty acid desaturase [Pseudomonas fluorescens]MDP9785048.1 fatty acid desaturase [Pseudomonas fluorescens]